MELHRIIAPLACLALALGPAGCGTEVERIPGQQSRIDLRISTPPYQDAFADVASLRALLWRPDAEPIEHVVDGSATEFVLTGAPAAGMVLRLEGLDIDGQLVASGQSPPFDLEPGQTAEVGLLFARVGELTPLLGELNHARFGHRLAVTAGDRVLVFGGAGGGSPDAPADLVPPEIYDPHSQSSCGFGNFDCPSFSGADMRVGHSTTATAAGDVLVFGGRGPNGNLVETVLVYDSGSQDFRRLGGLDPQRVQPRADHAAVVLQVEDPGDNPYREAILIAGGRLADDRITENGLLFDTRLETFFRTDLQLRHGRSRHTATVFGAEQRLVLIAGGTAAGGLVAAVELFNGTDFQAINPAGADTSAALAQPRIEHVAAARDDGVLIAAGSDGLRSLDAPERFVFNAPQGTGMLALEVAAAHPAHTPRSAPLAAPLAGGGLLLAGGVADDGFERRLLSSAEVLTTQPDLAQAGFAEAPPLRMPWAHAAAARLSGGGVVLCGGLTSGPAGEQAGAAVWYFNPG